MDFERGIWQAALDGNVKRVRLLLDKGWDPDARDGSGYTALVRDKIYKYAVLANGMLALSLRKKRSNCRIPGLIVSRRRHSLKNESEYNRGYSYANKWGGYSEI